ncbi:phosphodiester glycosidase family protein [Frigidibacter sp. MR17.24]|uniref:phosphodiester glycosidase family protein n=1 Tax=Frigidibacter sp. MR17.24 TaxID=3127345 RepID=UPI003FA5CD16
MLRRLLALLLGLGLGGPALAQGSDTCRSETVEGMGYALCEVPFGADLRLWLTAPDGRPVATFERLREMLASEGRSLVFAMNAGMYHADRRPVGLYIENGTEAAPIVTQEGFGNFGLVPNAVFCIGPERFSVIESRAFAAAPPPCRFATQSGPALVLKGALHPKFLADGSSRYVRNGVGVSADGSRAVFALSAGPVNFHQFARLFRDHLGLPDALYFDGNISRIYAPALGLNQGGRPMGPIVGLVAPR